MKEEWIAICSGIIGVGIVGLLGLSVTNGPKWLRAAIGAGIVIGLVVQGVKDFRKGATGRIEKVIFFVLLTLLILAFVVLAAVGHH